MAKQIHTNSPTQQQLLDIIQDIETGEVSVQLDRKASEQSLSSENGIYHFDTSNKWRIGVYVDCGVFDYIDYMRHGGKVVNHENLTKFYPRLVNYSSKFRKKNLSKEIWGIESNIYADL